MIQPTAQDSVYGTLSLKVVSTLKIIWLFVADNVNLLMMSILESSNVSDWTNLLHEVVYMGGRAPRCCIGDGPGSLLASLELRRVQQLDQHLCGDGQTWLMCYHDLLYV